MNNRLYKLINTYLSEVLFRELVKMDSKFLNEEISYFKSDCGIVFMIEDGKLKLTKRIWHELTYNFSLSVNEVHMVMVVWIRENLGINKRLTMAECSYNRNIII
jgi:hypothetical protein